MTALSAPGGYDPAWVLTERRRPPRRRPDALDRVRSGLRLVVVDDAQELTPAAGRLLETLAGPGTDVVLLGDPDSAVQTFRGADPRILASGWTPARRGPDPRPPDLPPPSKTVLGRGRTGHPEDRLDRRRPSPGRGPGQVRRGGRRPPPAGGHPGGGLRHRRAPAGPPARRGPLVADGRRRAGAEAHGDVAPGPHGGRGARRRAAGPTSPSATRSPPGPLLTLLDVVLAVARGRGRGGPRRRGRRRPPVPGRGGRRGDAPPAAPGPAPGGARRRRLAASGELLARPCASPHLSPTSAPIRSRRERRPDARRGRAPRGCGTPRADPRWAPGVTAESLLLGDVGRVRPRRDLAGEPRSAGVPPAPGPTATSTRSSRCSTRPPFVDRLPQLGPGCLPRPRPRPGRPRRHPRRPMPSRRERAPSSPHRQPRAASGGSSSSPASRRGSGPTCGCEGPSWGPSSSSTSSPVGGQLSVQPRRRCATTRHGSSSSP